VHCAMSRPTGSEVDRGSATKAIEILKPSNQIGVAKRDRYSDDRQLAGGAQYTSGRKAIDHRGEDARVGGTGRVGCPETSRALDEYVIERTLVALRLLGTE